jgi:N4-gp56 family major capsid protein
MASPITTTTQVAGPVNVVFQQTLLRNAKARCPYFVGSVPAEIREHTGSFTAKWRRIENLTPVSSALSELTGNVAFPTRDAVQPSVTDITQAVSKYGNYILLNEEVDLVNFTGQSDKLVEVLGINAGQSINRVQRDEMEDNATQIFSDGVVNQAAVVTKILLNDVKNAVNVIKRNDGIPFLPQTEGSRNIGTAPIRESMWGICHVDVEEDIRTLTGFNAVETYSGQTQTAPGEFGAVAGVRWLSTSEGSIAINSGGALGSTGLRSTGGSNIDIYVSVVFGKDAVGSLGFGAEHVKEIYTAGDKLPAVLAISKPRGSSGVADPLNELSTMGWKSWMAAKILNGDWIRCIESGATDL